MGTKFKSWMKEYFSNTPKIFFMVILFSICSATLVLDLKKEILIVDNNKETEIVTLRSNLESILEANDIVLEEKDKISADLDSKIKDGDKIYIKRAVNATVNVDGKQLDIMTAENTVNDMLKAEKIDLKELDKISPEITEKIVDNIEVSITRVTKKKVTEKEIIDFNKQVESSDNLIRGEKKTLQAGMQGEKVVTKEITYEDGKVVEEAILNEEIVKKPIDEIVAMGILDVVKTSRGGQHYYTNAINVTATAYTADIGPDGKPDDPYMGKTAIGTMCKRNPDGYSTIAVDPRVIPLGTKVYVEGYGLAIAEDVGGAIKGNKIDVYLNTYSEAVKWGRKSVKVYILKEIKN